MAGLMQFVTIPATSEPIAPVGTRGNYYRGRDRASIQLLKKTLIRIQNMNERELRKAERTGVVPRLFGATRYQSTMNRMADLIETCELELRANE